MDKGGGHLDTGGDGTARRACDQCRLRKIRCDKSLPCSNCRTAQRSCSSTGLGQKPRETRQRVLISTQYEKKIDHFEDRLRGIEDLLRRITTSLENRSSLPPPHPSESATPSSCASRPLTHSASSALSANPYDDDDEIDDDKDESDDDDDPDSLYGGASSLTAQTALASEFLEDAVEKTSLKDVSPEMKNALSSLKQIVGMQQRKPSPDRVRFNNQRPLPPGGFRELPMPPVQAVVPLLREFKNKSPDFLRIVGVFVTIEDFTDQCRRVYFATDEFNLATFIVVNAGLYYLFEELCATETNQPGLADFITYFNYCRDNVETCLASLPALTPARRDYIQALVFGSAYALEASKPSLAWRLNCTAIQLCVSLGYHRQTPGPESMLFWFAYMLDKGLTLRLGRASAIPDYDVIVPENLNAALLPDPWADFLNFALHHSEIQGRAHQHLYSITALNRPLEQRAETARLLAEQIKEIAAKEAELSRQFNASLSSSGMPDALGNSTALVLRSDQLTYWSTLTLIYRAIPSEPGLPSRPNADCITAARAAFQIHKECILLTKTNPLLKTKYIHWTILYAPFMPFIVLFCHVIESSDAEDLQRLAEFVASLQQSCGAAAAIDKLHRLCQVLYNVAAVYVETKARQQQDEDMAPIGNDFDMYLTQLKLLPQAGGAPLVSSMPGGVADVSDQALQLGDWFSGGSNMMGLLEEDLSMFEPEEWPSYAPPSGDLGIS